MNRRYRFYASGGLALSLALSFTPLHADPAPKASARPILRYVSVNYGGQAFGGDFSGEEIVSSVKGFFAVPTVDPGSGLGLAFGVRTSSLGIELGYRRTSHGVHWGDIRSQADWHSVGVDGRLYSPAVGPVRGFLGAGMAVEWLSVERGYCSDSTDLQCASRFEGLGFLIGPGVTVDAHDRLFLTIRTQYHWSRFDTVESFDFGAGTLPYAVDGRGWTWLTGIGLAL